MGDTWFHWTVYFLHALCCAMVSIRRKACGSGAYEFLVAKHRRVAYHPGVLNSHQGYCLLNSTSALAFYLRAQHDAAKRIQESWRSTPYHSESNVSTLIDNGELEQWIGLLYSLQFTAGENDV